MSWWEFRGFWGILQRSQAVSMQASWQDGENNAAANRSSEKGSDKPFFICFSETGFFRFQTTSKAAYIRPTATKPGLCGIIMNILIVKSIKNGHKAFIPPTI